MRKWILIFFPLFLWTQTIAAQDMVSCTQLLEDAKEAYTAGMVELVPELLLPCLESGGLAGSSRQEAYKLVINAYLFDYLPEEADSMMTSFVNDFPDYRSLDSDPAEFAQLLDSHLRARGIDPDAVKVVVDKDPVDTGDQVTRPIERPVERPIVYKPPFEYGNSMGFQLGINSTFPQIIERYSIGDPALDEGSFGIMPGFQVGAAMNLLLGESSEISFGLNYNRTRFKYSAAPLAFTSYVYEENQHRIQLPVSMIFKLNPQSPRTSVYLRVGIMPDFVLGASGAGTRSYTESLRDVVVEKTKITDSRARINLHGLAGFGIRFPMEKAFIFLESNFTSGLFKVNREENRFENNEIVWWLYHVDSDFKIHQLNFTVGMAWNL